MPGQGHLVLHAGSMSALLKDPGGHPSLLSAAHLHTWNLYFYPGTNCARVLEGLTAFFAHGKQNAFAGW